MGRDLLPDINQISLELSYSQSEKASVDKRIIELNTQISELEDRRGKIEKKINNLTSRKYLFGRKQYSNPDIRERLIRYGAESESQSLMEIAFTIEEKGAHQEGRSRELIDFLIILDNGLRESNRNRIGIRGQLSKIESPFEKEVSNDN